MINPFKLPGKLFNDYGGRLAIFLVKRRLKKNPKDPAIWFMLAKLHQVRGAKVEAIRLLKEGLKMCPDHPLLKDQLKRIRG